LEDGSDEEEDDSNEARQAQRQAEEEAAKKSKGNKNNNGGEDGGGEEGEDVKDPDGSDANGKKGKGGKEDEEDESVDSLLGKLRDLHAQMRLRHAINLKKANTEVLCLQTRIENSMKEYSLQDGTFISEKSSSSNSSSGGGSSKSSDSKGNNENPWRPLLLTLADLVNSSCLQIEEDFKTKRKNAEPIDATWWKLSLAKHIGWMNTLNTRAEVEMCVCYFAPLLFLLYLFGSFYCMSFFITSLSLNFLPFFLFLHTRHPNKHQHTHTQRLPSRQRPAVK
jgi:hypothetical protein